MTSCQANTSKILYDRHPNIFSFQDKGQHQLAQGIKWSNHLWLVVARKISVQADCLQTEVRSARSSVDPIDLQQAFQGPSAVLVPFVVRYRVGFSSALFNQLQLWHLHWLVEASSNVMAHAQKPDFVFRRNGRVHLNQRRASVQSTTGSQGVRMSGNNAGYTMFWGSVKGTGYPLSFASFPFTSPHVPHRVPSHFNWSLQSTWKQHFLL